MRKKTFITAVLGTVLAATSAFAEIECKAYTYAPGLYAAKGSRAKQLEIIKSWIPERIIIHDDRIQLYEDYFIDIDSRTDARIRANLREKDSAGKKMNMLYEIVFRENKTIANITVRQNRYKPLGPVIFHCQPL